MHSSKKIHPELVFLQVFVKIDLSGEPTGPLKIKRCLFLGILWPIHI